MVETNRLLVIDLGIHGGSAPGDPDQPNFLSEPYRRMEPHWRLPEALCGGTSSMRERGTLYLPTELEEEPLQWQMRLSRSFLHEAYSDTLDKINSKPFSTPITITAKESLDDRLAGLFTNADYEGSSITDFWAKVFYGVERFGLNHILVEAPQSDAAKTLQDELQQDIRPYFVEITPDRLLGFKTKKFGGVQHLTQIRFLEEITEEDGKYGDKSVKHIRVINADGTWELYRETSDKSGKYALLRSGTHTFKGIPLRTWYAKKTGFMCGLPPLEKLAWLNLMHWQSQSDQRNILRIARVGMLFLKGFGEDTKSAKFVVAANRKLSSENDWADAKWVEHSGKAIEAGRLDLMDIEDKMVMMGMEPFVQRSGDSSATGRVIRESHRMSRVQTWVKSGEAVLEDVIRLSNVRLHDDNMAYHRKMPPKFACNIFNEYAISMQAFEDMRLLLEAARVDKLSDKTLLTEFKRRGMLSDHFDLDEEVTLVKEAQKAKQELIGASKQGAVPPKRQKKSKVGSQKAV